MKMLSGGFSETSLDDSVLQCDFQIHSQNCNLLVNFFLKPWFLATCIYFTKVFELTVAALFQVAEWIQCYFTDLSF